MELVQERKELEGNLAKENPNQRKSMIKKRKSNLEKLPPRKKTLAKKIKAKQLPAHYPFISAEAKATFLEFI